MNSETLRQYLEFYRDLGIRDLYRKSAPAAKPEPPAAGAEAEHPKAPPPPALPPPPAAKPLAPAEPAASVPGLFSVLEELAPPDDTLEKILSDIGPCTRCRLHEGRNRIVFGDGNPQSPLVFVGEGPGADEDAQGIPFVGAAGQLLTTMIENTAAREGIPIKRKDVYICNVVKCRPPNNRNPLPDEMKTCGQFLIRQLMVIQPKAICALGATAAKALLGRKEGVTQLRGNWYRWHGIPVMVTYHPSYILRGVSREARREIWEDLKKVLHFVYD